MFIHLRHIMLHSLIRYALLTFTTALLMQSAVAAPVDRAAITQRYQDLKTQFEARKRTGVDTQSLAPLIAQIQEAVRAGQLERLNTLLDQFETALKAEPQSGSTAPTACATTSGVPPGPEGADLERQFISAVRGDPAYLRLATARAPTVSAEGAVGRNIRGFADVAAQRDTIWLILRGLATDNANDVEATVRSLAYAFRYQAPAGNFLNHHGVDAVRAVGIDAFFLQSFGRIYLLIVGSPFRECALPQLDALKPKLANAMHWLAANASELRRQDRLATNRLFFDAVAFDLNGRILDDPSLQTLGRSFAQAGLDNQRADGTFNEHNGADSSYQAVSILNIAGLLAYEQDQAWRARFRESITRAAAWERTKIGPDGEVAVQGNSRTGLGQEEFMGRKKEVNYPEVALALLYASLIDNDPALRTQGDSVIAYLGRSLHLWPSGGG